MWVIVTCTQILQIALTIDGNIFSKSKELNVCWVGVYTMIAISFEVVISS